MNKKEQARITHARAVLREQDRLNAGETVKIKSKTFRKIEVNGEPRVVGTWVRRGQKLTMNEHFDRACPYLEMALFGSNLVFQTSPMRLK